MNSGEIPIHEPSGPCCIMHLFDLGCKSWGWAKRRKYSLFRIASNTINCSFLLFHQCRFVTDATVSLFVAVLLFILPSEPPSFLCCRRSADAGSEQAHCKLCTDKTYSTWQTLRPSVKDMLPFFPLTRGTSATSATRPCPPSPHLAGDSEEDALEHHPAAGRRLCSG